MRWDYLWSLVSPEVLAPSRTPCVLLQTLLLCPPITITTINWWDQMRNNLFWNQTWTTLMSRPVSVASCSLTCRAGFGDVLYAFFNTCDINAGIHVGILSAFFIWTSQWQHLHLPGCDRGPGSLVPVTLSIISSWGGISMLVWKMFPFFWNLLLPSAFLFVMTLFNPRYAQLYASLVFFQYSRKYFLLSSPLALALS